MMNSIIKFLLLGAVVWFAADAFSGISVADYKHAIIAAVVLSFINAFIEPVLRFLAFPITLLTLGLFSFVISAGMVMLMDHFVDGFSVSSFVWALAFSAIISVAGSLIDFFT